MAKGNDVAGPMREGEDHSVSVRKIDNGYVIRTSSCGNDGNYQSSEVFSKEMPEIRPPAVINRQTNGNGGSSLSSAVKALKSR